MIRRAFSSLKAIVDLAKLKLNDSEAKAVERMIRVNQAGELGAVQIYSGQMAILKSSQDQSLLSHMMKQEQVHFNAFNQIVADNNVRPTIMWPLWRIAGFSLGVTTALLGKESAMLCTEAVETVIGKHYNDQLRKLESIKARKDPNDSECIAEFDKLKNLIKKFRDEELEHLDTAVEQDSKKAPLYPLISSIIHAGCKTAIFISERI